MMKKLLIITDMYPDPPNPAAGIFVWHQVRELARLYEVRVLATSFPFPYREEYSEEYGYPLHYVYYPQIRFYPLTVLSYRRFVAPRIRQLLKDWQPDLIHVHDCRHIPELLALRPLLKDFAGRKFLTVHNIKTHPDREKRLYLKLTYALTLRPAYTSWTHIFTVNDRLRAQLIPEAGADKVSRQSNGISALCPALVPEQLTGWLQEGHYRLLGVGNLVRTKGFDLLIRAVQELKLQHLKIQLLIIGSGSEHGRLQQMITRLGLEQDVRIEPAQPNDVVRNLYGHFDAFVLPSYSETFGIVYLEAMSAGIPVVGVRREGIHGLAQDGIEALFAEPGEVADIVAKVRFLMDHPEQARKMAAAGKELVVRDFRLDTLIQRLIGHYEA
jgi:glycosyltransferase involved in cell wall biosynthesis